MRTVIVLALGLAALPRETAAQSTDSAFAGVQHRGATVMGVDQYASRHVFEDLPDGGRIVLVMRDTSDTIGAATIRAHLRGIAEQFARGVFTDPAAVHAMAVPGAAVMAERRVHLSYQVRGRAGGGELRITTSDPQALLAIREFLAFQRMDHRAPGTDTLPDHGTHDHSTHQHGTE